LQFTEYVRDAFRESGAIAERMAKNL